MKTKSIIIRKKDGKSYRVDFKEEKKINSFEKEICGNCYSFIKECRNYGVSATIPKMPCFVQKY